MDVIAVLAVVALGVSVGAWRWRRSRSFAVRRYEHTYSAIDAAVGRARRADGVVPSAGAPARHVVIVEPATVRRPLGLVPPTAGADPATGGGVSSPLAG